MRNWDAGDREMFLAFARAVGAKEEDIDVDAMKFKVVLPCSDSTVGGVMGTTE
jgi:hypothetical protein